MRDSLLTLFELFTLQDFHVGILAGLGGAVVWFVLARKTEKSILSWAAINVLAVLAGLAITADLDPWLLIGLVIISIGSGFLERASKSTSDGHRMHAASWFVLGLGAVAIAMLSGLPENIWMRWGVPMVGVLGGYALMRFQTTDSRYLLGVIWVVTCFGVWATVPDTEAARVMLGVSIPLALTATASHEPETIGSFSLIILLAWIVVTGGSSRPASVIGGWACLGVLLLTPALSGVRYRRLLEPLPLMILHAVWVLISARVVGQWPSAFWAAITLAIPLTGTAFILSNGQAVKDPTM